MYKRSYGAVAFIAGFVAVFALVMLLSSCATMTKKGMTTNYENIGFALSTAYNTLTAMEKNGTLNGDSLAKAKTFYGEARKQYLLAGDLLKVYIVSKTLGDALTTREKYQLAMSEVSKIVIQLTNIYGGKK